MRRVVGLDLAGSPARTTGGCRLDGPRKTTTRPLYDDEEIVSWTLEGEPEVVCIDAPLGLPRGRKSLDIPSPPHFRLCDLELRRLGIPFFPITLGPMRMLTARGIRLKARFEAAGVPAIESYPGGAQDMLGIPRKNQGTERLRRALLRRGFRGDVERGGLTHDELDAVLCAWVGRWFVQGNALAIGDASEGRIYLPPLSESLPEFRARWEGAHQDEPAKVPAPPTAPSRVLGRSPSRRKV